jgi:DNA (cytosine-5)-methyltransferase 1
MSTFTFIDLFCGIGGFHQALTALGGKCVFASDIDKNCNEVYRQNYNIDSAFDITKVMAEDIPRHDVLCGGFPCQAFSKAGKQKGVNDTRGTLFFEIERILKVHRTKYILLENVRNLVSHDNGNTWRIIHENLCSIGYRITKDPLILSPHQFGIPQVRERVYIIGVYDPENANVPLEIELPPLKAKSTNSAHRESASRRPMSFPRWSQSCRSPSWANSSVGSLCANAPAFKVFPKISFPTRTGKLPTNSLATASTWKL